MAYNGFGYGNYGNYYQQQQQQQQQPANQQQNTTPSGGNNQRYQGQANTYSPYYQTSTASYGQQAQSEPPQQSQGQSHAQQYQSKPAEAPSYPQSYYQSQQSQQPQQYTQRTAAESGDGLYSASRHYGASSSAANQSASTTASSAPQYQYGQSLAGHTDTSALGSLAYASSLGRSSPATSHQRYNQPAATVTSQSSGSPVYQTQQHQQNAYGQSSTTSAQKQASPYMSQRETSTRSPQQTQPRQIAVSQHRQSQPVHSRVSSASSRHNRYPSPLQGAVSRTPASQNATVSQASVQQQQPGPARSASLRSPPVQTSSVSPAQQNAYSGAPTRPSGQRNEKMPSPNLMKASYGSSAPRQQLSEPGPITVDPSQVFDQAEYQRRKAAAEAEAEAEVAAQKAQADSVRLARQHAEAQAAKAVEDEEAKADAERKKAEVEAAVRAADASQRPKADSQSRDQIQAEMKAMIEKMREYKAQDPTAFTEIWEQFKKMQGPPGRTSSQSGAAGNVSTRTPIGIDQTMNSLSLPLSVGGSRGDITGAPDRGKFPAMRRRTRTDKGTAKGKGAAKTNGPAPAAAASATQPRPLAQAPQISQSQVHPASQPGPPQAAIPGHDPTGADTMRMAMARYHNTPTPGPSSSNQSSPQPGSAGFPQGALYAQKPQVKGTVWPEKDKAKLAAVAKQCLESYPPNHGKTISTTSIHQFLNRNPSYDQLCEILVKEGFQLDRSQFARTLLAVVPSDPTPAPNAPLTSTPELQPTAGGGKRKRGRPSKDGSQQSTPSSHNNNPASAGAPISQSWQASTGLQKPLVFKEPFTKASPPLGAHGQARSASISSQHSAPEYQDFHNRMRAMSGALAQGTAISTAQAKTKQEAARKRTFHDLVDMTQVSDDEDMQHNNKKLERGGAGVADNKNTTMASGGGGGGGGDVSEKAALSKAQRPLASSFNQFRANDPFRSAKESLRKAPVCEDLDYSRAIRRETYNPNTVARDILITKGIHPSERPLNEHLAHLRDTFAVVNWRSDLSTLRWDLIDPKPGEPEASVLKSIEKDDRANGGPALGSTPPPAAGKHAQNTKFKSVLTSRGGHAMSHRGTLPSIRSRGRGHGRGGLVSRPSTRGVLQVTPSRSQPATAFTPVNRTLASTMDSDMADTHDETSEPEATKVPSMMAASIDVLNPLKNPRVAALAGSGSSPLDPGSSSKRRGRPPGSKNRKTIDQIAAGDSGTPKKRGRPAGSKNSSSGRKPGRPPKARPELINRTIPEDGVGILLPQEPAQDIPVAYTEPVAPPVKRRKNWKTGNLYPDRPEDDAYLTFDCDWIGCQSGGLHNLATLRKHVFKIHVPRAETLASGDLLCAWGACADTHHDEPDADEDSDAAGGGVYAGQTALREHIERVHLAAVAKALGDGPDAHPPVVDPSAWLSDASGRPVTPMVLTEGPKDPVPLNAGYRAKLSYHSAHGNLTPAEKTRALDESYRIHRQMGHLGAFEQPEEDTEESDDEDEGIEEEGQASRGAKDRGEGSGGEEESDDDGTSEDGSEDELGAA